jgi:hypothetical protein
MHNQPLMYNKLNRHFGKYHKYELIFKITFDFQFISILINVGFTWPYWDNY